MNFNSSRLVSFLKEFQIVIKSLFLVLPVWLELYEQTAFLQIIECVLQE